MTQKTKNIVFICSIAALLLTANFADAAIVKCGETLSNPKPCTIRDLIEVVVAIINIMLSWAWLVSMLFVVWGGWQMVTSGGNDEKIAAGKTIFSQAIIGFFLVLASFVLINFVVGILFGDGKGLSGSSWTDAFKLLP